jgi:hypothetical protein
MPLTLESNRSAEVLRFWYSISICPCWRIACQPQSSASGPLDDTALPRPLYLIVGLKSRNYLSSYVGPRSDRLPVGSQG